MMTQKTKRVLQCVALLNIAFFVYLIYIVYSEFDTFIFYRTSLHTLTEEVDGRLFDMVGMMESADIPLVPISYIGGIAKVINTGACAYLLFGNHRYSVLPITRRETIVLFLAAYLINFCYTSAIRAAFADTYCRLWMLLADDIYLPLLFFVVTLYGIVQLRRGRTPPTPA